eukprot:2440286-Amphidinium_carterae.1
MGNRRVAVMNLDFCVGIGSGRTLRATSDREPPSRDPLDKELPVTRAAIVDTANGTVRLMLRPSLTLLFASPPDNHDDQI